MTSRGIWYLAALLLALFPAMLFLLRPQRAAAFAFLGMAMLLFGLAYEDAHPARAVALTGAGTAVVLATALCLAWQRRQRGVERQGT
jgi:hypothetical protein